VAAYPPGSVDTQCVLEKKEYKDYNFREAVLNRYPDADNPYREYVDESGREFEQAPIRGNIGYSHIFIFNYGSLLVNGTLFYEGEGIDQWLNWDQPDRYSMPGRDDYWLADVSAMFSSTYGMPAGNMWYVRLRCNNVTNGDALATKTYSTDIFFVGENLFNPRSGTIMGIHVLPRTFGVFFGIDW
jgi:hypothetical protein